MTYTIISSKQTGDSLSAKEYNAYIKDNGAASVPDIFTTKGDIAVATGLDAAERLGVGVNGSYYWADSGATGGISTCLVDRVGAKPDGTNTWWGTRESWLATTYMTAENFDTASAYASYTFTAPKSGYYLVMVGVATSHFGASWDANVAPFYLRVGVLKNSAIFAVLFHELIHATLQNYALHAHGVDIMSLAKGDTLQPARYLNTDNTQAKYDGTATLTAFSVAPLL